MKKVYVSDTAALEALLAEANGRVQRSVKVEDVVAAVRKTEELLRNLGLSQQTGREVSITVNPSRNRQPKVNAYKFSAQAVEVVIKKNTVGWYVASAEKRSALFDTFANRQDSFVSIPDALFTKHAASLALGVRIEG